MTDVRVADNGERVCECGHSAVDHVTRGCQGMTINWQLRAHMPCNCQGYQEAKP